MPGESIAVVATANEADWQAVANKLAAALRTTMVRNPNLTARDWDRASAALEQYDVAAFGVVAEFLEPSDA